jgi:hypothetical protein
MRFNPPPNWPQPPADWTPPPGWEPDPSWPPLPSGWPLWVADDEFIISPYGAAAPRTRSTQSTQLMRSTQPWYRQTVAVVLFLIFFFPVGLVLLWLRPDWSVRRRGIITAVVGAVALFALIGSTAPPPTTTALSPTTVGATASPSHAAAASKSAVPSPAATTPRPPVTSAPPKKTVAAAPVVVHTSAAPAYSPPPAPAPTTQAPQAPQPVQTTAQAQQGCYPLTNGGNCYTPGEYCRDDDHGQNGIDANGDPITCEDNDGWRWERG